MAFSINFMHFGKWVIKFTNIAWLHFIIIIIIFLSRKHDGILDKFAEVFPDCLLLSEKFKTSQRNNLNRHYALEIHLNYARYFHNWLYPTRRFAVLAKQTYAFYVCWIFPD